MFPKNTWYVACTPDEINDGPLGRRICGDSQLPGRGTTRLRVGLRREDKKL